MGPEEEEMLDRLKTLVREPALIIDFAETLLVALALFGFNLSNDQQATIIAVVVAGLGFVKALMVHPFAPGVVVDLGRAVLFLMIAFGLHVSSEQAGVLITLLGTLVTLVLTNRTTPVAYPDPNTPGLPANLVAKGRAQRGEAGYATLEIVGLILIVLAVLGLILLALHVFKAVGLVWLIILLVIGAALWLYGRRTV